MGDQSLRKSRRGYISACRLLGCVHLSRWGGVLVMARMEEEVKHVKGVNGGCAIAQVAQYESSGRTLSDLDM